MQFHSVKNNSSNNRNRNFLKNFLKFLQFFFETLKIKIIIIILGILVFSITNIDWILNFQDAIPQKFFEKLKFLQFFFETLKIKIIIIILRSINIFYYEHWLYIKFLECNFTVRVKIIEVEIFWKIFWSFYNFFPRLWR